MKSHVVPLIGPVVVIAAMVLVFCPTSFAQVTHCTGDGCTDFEIACGQSGGQTICLNANSEFVPTQKDMHLCDVALAIMEKNCNKLNDQPCIVAEDRVVDRCYYLPLTMCVDPDTASELFLTYPDMCIGICDNTQACNNF